MIAIDWYWSENLEFPVYRYNSNCQVSTYLNRWALFGGPTPRLALSNRVAKACCVSTFCLSPWWRSILRVILIDTTGCLQGDPLKLITVRPDRWICREHCKFSQRLVNPLSSKLNNLNFHPLEVMSRCCDPQLQAGWKLPIFVYSQSKHLQILMFETVTGFFNRLIKQIKNDHSCA